MRRMSKENVRAFTQFMTENVHCQIISTANSEIRDILHMMGIRNARKFLDKYAITLGNTIFVPFKIGEGDRNKRTRQVEVLCHEMIHVHQYRHNAAKFAAEYALSRSKRAHYEAEAIHADIELHYYLTGAKYDVSRFVDMLQAYRVRRRDLRVTKKHLTLISKFMKQGKGSHAVTRVAMKWWAR